jgi:hypothetical protein
MSDLRETFKRINRHIQIMAGVANVGGGLITFLYFALADPIPTVQFQEREAFLPTLSVYLVILGIMMAILVILTQQWSRRAFRHIIHWQHRLEDGATPADVPVDIQRRVINYVPQNTAINFAGWLLAGNHPALHPRGQAANGWRVSSIHTEPVADCFSAGWAVAFGFTGEAIDGTGPGVGNQL